jgi:hypothetical protein
LGGGRGGELGGEEDGGELDATRRFSFSGIKKLCTCISIKKGGY